METCSGYIYIYIYAGAEVAKQPEHTDEYQYYIPKINDKNIFTWVIQDDKEEPAPDGRIWTKPHEVKDGVYKGKFVRHYHRFGELCIECHRKVGEQLGMNIPLDGEYCIGRSWAGTH